MSDRRAFLGNLATGLGSIALASLLAEEANAHPLSSGGTPKQSERGSAKPGGVPGKAKRVIQIFCPGAASSLDMWDYKPGLTQHDGEMLPGADALVTFQGGQGKLAKSPYGWKPYGQSGKWLSDIVPHIAQHADALCFLHAMTAKSNTHGPATLQMNTGFIFEGFPSMGAWATFALGSLTADLPAFVAIPDVRGLPIAGPANWSNGFLPAAFQGVAFNTEKQIPDLDLPKGASPDSEKRVRGFLDALNKGYGKRAPGYTELDARLASYALAARMQLSAPEATDLSKETAATHQLYGTDSSNQYMAAYAKNCILARRLVERGVRFVQLYCGASSSAAEGSINWDAHQRLKSDLDRHCPILDQPTAALLTDLKQRGLLEDTLVLWTTEFGRMPTFQARTQGRDHNPQGFTVWMAGAGVKGGFSYGATDELGWKAEQNVTTIYDFHATVLHLLGLDHKKLTYYHNGANRRLTDVHGEVIREVLA
ncbi:DUF1501 domain-containing protein [Armatimonas sp.]|uniref:DUF1501 domain-containing protein n=1 Tax=Armatimonas sp. TaxID=1872638 RepID=UPI0037536AD8